MCKLNDVWLSAAQLRQLEFGRQAMQRGYAHLSYLSALKSESLWAMKPKFHGVDEFVLHAQESKLNPGSHWNFGTEDLCGRIGKIASIVHPMTMDLRVAQRWSLSFFVPTAEVDPGSIRF